MDKNHKYDKKWELPSFEIVEFKPRKTKYCIGIPIINEGEKFKKQLMEMRKFSDIIDVIIFDGGSNDESTNHDFLKQNGVRTLLIKKSKGKQGAQLRMGFAYALSEGYQGIITIDGNGKDNPNAIPSFIKALDENFDFVQGSRFLKGGKAINTPISRLFGVRFLHAPLISLAANFWYTDTTNGFRAYSRRYLLHPKVLPFRNIFVGYELLFYLSIRAPKLGLKTKEIPVTRSYPKNKIPTKINGLKGNLETLLTTFKVVTNYYNP